MPAPECSFRWRTLELRFVARRPVAELSTADALTAARQQLEDVGGRAEAADGEGKLRFRATYRAGRSWLSCVMGGTVCARTDERDTTVEASASLVPLAAYTALATGGALALGLEWVALLLAFGAIGVGNYLFVHFGLRAVVRAAARGVIPVRRAA